MSRSDDSYHSYVASLKSYIPGAVHHNNFAASVVDVPCGKCQRMVEGAHHCARRMPPDNIVKVLKTRGWTIGTSAKKHVCPNHRRKDHEMKGLHMVETSETAIAASQVAASDAARCAKRAVLDWLGESFDVEAGRYKTEAVTDATIAKETGVSEATVKQLREDFFGPMKAPPELQTVLSELQRIEAEGKAQQEALVARIKTLNDRITTVIEKNGWKS